MQEIEREEQHLLLGDFTISPMGAEQAAPTHVSHGWLIRLAGLCGIGRSLLVLFALHWHWAGEAPLLTALFVAALSYLLLGIGLLRGTARPWQLLAFAVLAGSDLALSLSNRLPWQAALFTAPSLIALAAVMVALLDRRGRRKLALLQRENPVFEPGNAQE